MSRSLYQLQGRVDFGKKLKIIYVKIDRLVYWLKWDYVKGVVENGDEKVKYYNTRGNVCLFVCR